MNSYDAQMMGCQRKGKEAFERGARRDSCPYRPKPWATGTGARNLTKRRKAYWLYGYDTAAGVDPIQPQEFRLQPSCLLILQAETNQPRTQDHDNDYHRTLLRDPQEC